MKVDFTQTLTTLDGSKLTDPDGGEVSLSTVAVNALQMNFPDEKDLEGKVKLERWELAKKVFNSEACELEAEEVVMIKELVSKAYGTIVVGQVFELLK